MKRTKPLIVISAAVAAAAAWFAMGVVPDKDAPTASPAEHQSAVESAGYVVHIDPATGRVAEPSPSTVPVAIDEQWSNRLSTSSEGLVETDSPVPGGGTMVDLQGRFQNMFVAAVDDSGRVGAACISDPAKASGEGGEER
jgi:hypothetical protein